MIKEDQGYEQLEKDVVAYVDHVYPDKNKTFKMHVRRAKKTYPGTSMELNADLGGAILDAFPEMKVDVHDPQLLITVEIREKIYIYSESIPGPGGMPIGTNGKSDAFVIRWYRLSGSRLHDRKTWRKDRCGLFPCTRHTPANVPNRKW